MKKTTQINNIVFTIIICFLVMCNTAKADGLNIKTAESTLETNSIVLEAEEAEELVSEEALDKEEQNDLVEFKEKVELLQNGDMISQSFECTQNMPALFSGEKDSWENVLRRRISETMAAVEEFVDVSDLGINRFNDISLVRLIYRSCIRGDRFYVSGSFSYYCDEDGNIIKIKVNYYGAFCDATGIPDKEKVADYTERFYHYASKGIEYAGRGRNKLEQALLAHDWIVRECEYDYENYAAGSIPSESYNAYGCLVKGSAVCNGYALAYSYIMEELGYDSFIIASDSMNHAWNMIEIDSQWLHVDTTWDDPVFRNGVTYYNKPNNDVHDEGVVLHEYFLKTDEEFEELGHYKWKIHNSEVQLPESPNRDLFTGYVFAEGHTETEFALINNTWYFTKDAVLYKAENLHAEYVQTVDIIDADVYYMHAFKDKLYFTDFKNIYCCEVNKERLSVVLISTDSVSELAVRNNEIIYVLQKEGTYERRILDETESIPSIQSVKMKSLSKILIQWSEQEGCNGYILYRSTNSDSGYAVVKTINQSDLTEYINTISDDKDYYYKIRAYVTIDGKKVYGNLSNVMMGSVLGKYPEKFSYRPISNDRIRLEWDPVKNADGYILYCYNEETQTYKVIKNITNSTTFFYNRRYSADERQYSIRAYKIIDSKRIYSEYAFLNILE